MTQNAVLPVVEPPTTAQLETLIAAAVRAPSGDNMQPWSFVANLTEQCIDVHLNPARDCSPMNAGQQMSLIACGAAIENALILAKERGWNANLELEDPPPIFVEHCPLVARIRMISRRSRNGERAPDHFSNIIAARVTNRRFYDQRTLAPHMLSDLGNDTPDRTGISTHWIHDRAALPALSKIIARGDAMLFGEPSMRRAIMANIRFDLPPNAEAAEGLPLAALEASASKRFALRVIRKLPDSMFKLTAGASVFAAHAQALVLSASGLCVIALNESVQQPEIRIGQALQRAWLALTGLGVSAQPMMSLMVIDNALQHGTPDLIASLGRTRSETLLNELGKVLKSHGITGQPRFLLRFGYAKTPSGRTGRLEKPRA